jgi:Ca2+-transporting ATPase
MYLSDPTLPYSTIAQTCAFSVLAISELFHMLGMTSATKSFVHNFKTKNKLLWIAFAVGFALQFIVVQTPGLNSFFKCTALDIEHWLLIVGLSLLPLIVHEVVVLILHLKKKITSK